MTALGVYQRMAMLWTKKQGNPDMVLSDVEYIELDLCQQANANYMWKRALLENYSFMASLIDDMDWQHEICMEIDLLQKKITGVFDDEVD
jgi:hypothetical protein